MEHLLISALIVGYIGQFELDCGGGSSVSRNLEGTAPMYDTNQLHAAVVELVF